MLLFLLLSNSFSLLLHSDSAGVWANAFFLVDLLYKHFKLTQFYFLMQMLGLVWQREKRLQLIYRLSLCTGIVKIAHFIYAKLHIFSSLSHSRLLYFLALPTKPRANSSHIDVKVYVKTILYFCVQFNPDDYFLTAISLSNLNLAGLNLYLLLTWWSSSHLKVVAAANSASLSLPRRRRRLRRRWLDVEFRNFLRVVRINL